jgi:tRNA pseudouridine55 synthase
VRFGMATTTYDAQGSDLLGAGEGGDREPRPVDLSGLDAALAEFRGTYLQTPPAFSAKKVSGTPAYELARAGQAPELTPVQVTVSLLEIVDRGERTARLRVACSSGFYVRTLAHEIGQRLGCGAHLSALRRTRAGSFDLRDAVALDVIQAEGAAAAARIVPLERLLPLFPGVVLTSEGVRRALHGNLVPPSEYGPEGRSGGSRVRLLDEGGALLGIAEAAAGGLLHPVIVLV